MIIKISKVLPDHLDPCLTISDTSPSLRFKSSKSDLHKFRTPILLIDQTTFKMTNIILVIIIYSQLFYLK